MMLATISKTIKHIYLLLVLLFFLKCNSNSTNSNKVESEKDKTDLISNKPDDTTTSEIEKSSSFKQKKAFIKQSIDNIDNSIWINTPFPDCIDSLIILNEGGYFYSCERTISSDIEWKIISDTLFINQFGLISEVDENSGMEIKSKYKIIKSDNKLVFVQIEHRYGQIFHNVGEEFLFQEFEKIKTVANKYSQ